MVTLLVSPEERLTVTGFAGALGSDTANVAVWPSATEVLAGIEIVPALCTVTLKSPCVTPVAVAWIAVVPMPAPVTATVTELEFAGITTVAGTVAVVLLSEVSVTVNGFNVDPGRFSVTFCVPPAVTFTVFGVKLSAPFTVAVRVAEA